MSAKSGIAWTDATWNPVVGCTKVSQGCKHCYAKTLHDMRHKAYLQGKMVPLQYAFPFETVQTLPNRLAMPLGWKKRKKIFVNSMSDLFHEDVPDGFISQVMDVMEEASWHTFQILTKRPERMAQFFGHDMLPRNVWVGTTVENQKAADERIPALVMVNASVRFLSCEPLLESVDLQLRGRNYGRGEEFIQWVICGGESGPDARPMHADWARSVRDQCHEAGVPFFFKQWGEWCHNSQAHISRRRGKEFHDWHDGSGSLRVGVDAAGGLLDMQDWLQFPKGG